jgi:uncharacterized protein YecE (DUF72 family)
MAGSFHLGTSGFAYDEWMHGVFYPDSVRPAGRLAYYASVFNSVEINYTFRRFPSAGLFEGWSRQTPETFRFTLKASAKITHVGRMRNPGPLVELFLERAAALGPRMGPVLFRVPEELPYDRSLLEAFADQLPKGLVAVMECREPSWRPAQAVLEDRGIAWCVTDMDEAASRPQPLTGPFGYIRLRRESYDDAELGAWAERIGEALDDGRDVYCYFRHEDAAAGPRMALRLRELLGR